jgi:hypothetical protein
MARKDTDRDVAGRLSRRASLTALLGGIPLAGLRTAANAQTASPERSGSFPWRRLINELAVTDGKYKDAFRCAPNGPVNWYFGNLGLAFLTQDAPDLVRCYMDVYLKSVSPERSDIADVAADLSTRVPADSHDACAGTFISLAVRYTRTTGDKGWWLSNLDALKAIAYWNIVTQIKQNGLVRAFQAPAENGTGYLMDQCEAYAGLRAFGQQLLETGDRDGVYFSSFGRHLGNAIHTLFDSRLNLWNWCDVPSPESKAWYPNLTAQIYPHLHDVHSDDAPGDYYRLHRGYEVLQQAAPDWLNRPQDLYPWLVVGYYVAACQSQVPEALTMVNMALRYYLPGLVNTGRMLISEIGYAKAILELGSGYSMPNTSIVF